MKCHGCPFMLLPVSRPASTTRRTISAGTGLSWYVRTATTVRTASKTSMLAFLLSERWRMPSAAPTTDVAPWRLREEHVEDLPTVPSGAHLAEHTSDPSVFGYDERRPLIPPADLTLAELLLPHA